MALPTTLLTTVICQTFLKEAGKFQNGDQGLKKAMVVSFSTRVDYDKEEGYRQIDLVLYAPANYVGVYERRRWTVIPLDDLEYDEEAGESFVKPGKSYVNGGTEWKLICYHDSCWRTDGVHDFLNRYADDINTFDGAREWFKIVDVDTLDLPDH